jgi:hypothetical protein
MRTLNVVTGYGIWGNIASTAPTPTALDLLELLVYLNAGKNGRFTTRTILWAISLRGWLDVA